MKKSFIIKLICFLTLSAIFLTAFASCGGDGEDETSAAGTDAPVTVDSDSSDALEVKEITDENGNVVGKEYCNSDGVLIAKELLDDAGRTTEYTNYTASGEIYTSDRYTYLYNNEIGRHEFEIREYEGGALKKIVNRVYTGGELLLSVEERDADGNLIEAYNYKYDEEGRMISETHLDSKYVITLITEYEYDGSENVSKTTYKNGKGDISSWTVFVRDDDGKVQKEENYDKNGEMTSYLEYVYDENGDAVETHEYMPDENGDFERID